MTQSTAPQTPGVPAPTSGVWPPLNPSGTVIPFPLPWGQTGCCPPGGMDALMKCYCDIQQASAFIGQIMIDQINNNPAVVQAIIAAIEKSGSNLPLIGVTNGSDAQPGQVGEYVRFTTSVPYIAGRQTTFQSLGVLQPGDWDCWSWAEMSTAMNVSSFILSPQPTGFTSQMVAWDEVVATAGTGEAAVLIGSPSRALISVPTLVAFSFTLDGTPNTGTLYFFFQARRRR